MTSAVMSTTKRNRAPNWEAEFYKNGYPKEIIVIEDTPPPEQDQKQPSSTTRYTVVTAPAPPPNITALRPQASGQSNSRQQKRGRQERVETNLVASDNDDLASKRRRKNPHYDSSYFHHHPTSNYPLANIPLHRQPQPVSRTNWEPLPLADKDGHFIVRPGEFLTERYEIHETLGQGTYGKVVKCYDHVRRTYCAIKIIRAIPKYREASQTEIKVLNTLKEHDQLNFNQCIHLVEWFEYYNHVCMVFELLDQSVYDFLKANHFEPFPIHHIQHFAKQLLNSVAFIHDLKMIHTDLKPENILLKNHGYGSVPAPRTKRGSVKILHNTEIILIDFGSATFENDYHSSVVSTRHYRAPEIILGLGWSYPCDIWSIGCILVEFFTGEALFQTHDNLEHLAMMEVVLGKIPKRLVDAASRDAAKYFKDGRLLYPGPNTSAQSQKYVKGLQSLKDTILPRNIPNLAFLDLLQRMLTYDPAERITAREALRHPFFHIEFDSSGRVIG